MLFSILEVQLQIELSGLSQFVDYYREKFVKNLVARFLVTRNSQSKFMLF